MFTGSEDHDVGIFEGRGGRGGGINLSCTDRFANGDFISEAINPHVRRR